MPSYVVLGASRGIGLGLVKVLAADKNNTVIGLVRNVEAGKAKFAAEIPDATVHAVHADLNNRKSLETAATEVAAITGGAVDVFVANAAIGFPIHKPLSEEATSKPDEFEKNMIDAFRTNVLGTVQALSYFAPLVAKSDLKKLVVISSGVGDLDLTLESGMEIDSPYSISKAAVNMAVAKLHVEYREKGVLVFAISPGLVDTEFTTDPNAPPPTEEEVAAANASMGRLIQKLRVYAPDWEPRLLTPLESAQAVVKVIAGATIAKDGGKMVSHWGNKQWL
ncbi:hypothetical protein SCUCBS95973_005627 [Sporothrix curviconia]|uniref:NAD(P)-binding protein n=1 Tax=Sporothrix curviconia TaxID=1260050 RepID=A0ABP0BZA1_9PEZI